MVDNSPGAEGFPIRRVKHLSQTQRQMLYSYTWWESGITWGYLTKFIQFCFYFVYNNIIVFV